MCFDNVKIGVHVGVNFTALRGQFCVKNSDFHNFRQLRSLLTGILNDSVVFREMCPQSAVKNESSTENPLVCCCLVNVEASVHFGRLYHIPQTKYGFQTLLLVQYTLLLIKFPILSTFSKVFYTLNVPDSPLTAIVFPVFSMLFNHAVKTPSNKSLLTNSTSKVQLPDIVFRVVHTHCDQFLNSEHFQ